MKHHSVKQIKDKLDTIENDAAIETVDKVPTLVQFEMDLKKLDKKKLPDLLTESVNEEYHNNGKRPSKTMQIIIALLTEK